MHSDPLLRRLRRRLGRTLERLGLKAGALVVPEVDVGPDPPPGPVDVVVPIHGAHDVATACLESVARHTDLDRHRLRVVVDGDPGFRDDDVRRAAGEGRLEVLRNPEAQGFVKSVNRAMASSSRDVVLLNSDTVVTHGWLDKMQAAAYASHRVATVTPFSNNATICSLPEPLVANDLPAGFDVDRFAALVEDAAAPSWPRLPTGVGFCLYVKRRILDRVGLFDEEAFGDGYGEETEFCFRAAKAGFVHVLDDATFVFHHGEKSFGESRRARVRAAERTLRRLHPEYLPTIAAFLDADPLAEARRRVRWALRRAVSPPAGPKRVLHLVHGWPPHNLAGTELYARWLATEQVRHREVAVYARVADPARSLGEATEDDDDGMRVRLVVNNFTQRNPLSRNALGSRVLDDDFRRFLEDVRPDLVHVHHLAGHAVSLLDVAARSGAPIVYQVQDWWAMCARANLLRRPQGDVCPGPSPARCSSCLPLTGLPPAALLNPLLYRFRRRAIRRAIRRADAWVMGSRFIARSYFDAALLRPGERVYVLTYGVPLPSSPPPSKPPEPPLSFGFIGSLMPHKGLHVAVQAFRDVDPRRAVLEVWGDPAADPAYVEGLRAQVPPEVLRFHGRFAEDEKAAIFARLDALVVPSLGYESFGLVAREALAHGVPVLASRGSALGELLTAGEGRGGVTFPPGDAEALRRRIAELVAEPRTLYAWMAEAPPVVGCREHAEEIEQVYADVLERR